MPDKNESAHYIFDQFSERDRENILGGEAFRILPVGSFFRQGFFFDNAPRLIKITKEDIVSTVEHFNKGLPRFRVPINLDHSHSNGKVGTLTKVEARSDGLYGYADWTEAGREAIKAGSHDAVSAEMAWDKGGYSGKYTDPETGDSFSPVIVGLALTATPFFGHKRVALYSANAVEEDVPSNNPDKEIETMSDKPEVVTTPTAVSLDEFNALKTALENMKTANEVALKTQADELAAKLAEEKSRADTLAEQFANERKTRVMDALRNKAESFTALPIKADEYAEKFYALAERDAELAKWFGEKFDHIETLLAQAALFGQVSREDANTGQETFESFTAKILKEQFGGDNTKYVEAMGVASKQRPDLYEAYSNTYSPPPKRTR